jgi:hypothetical protein
MRNIEQLREDFINLRIRPTDWLGDSPNRFDTYAKYASMVDSVTEFGVYTGLSTTAFVSGKPLKVRSYDITRGYLTVLHEIEACAEQLGVDFQFQIASSLEVDIEETDLLFIDTVHEKDYCLKELNLHHSKAKKYIMLHDITAWPGVLQAAEEFMSTHPEWVIHERDDVGSGLLVISKRC